MQDPLAWAATRLKHGKKSPCNINKIEGGTAYYLYAIRSGVVWFGKVRCGQVRSGRVRWGEVWCGKGFWHITYICNAVGWGMVGCGKVRCGTVWFG